jgi:hypothetical protein
VVVAVLFTAGNQFPVIPFGEIVGSAASVPPTQIGATCTKFGVTFGLTVMVNVWVVAQIPAVGVNVYVVVAVLFNAGDHVPVIPSFDGDGSGVNVAPAQIGDTAVKVGVTFGVTVTVNVVVTAHCPADGVNV